MNSQESLVLAAEDGLITAKVCSMVALGCCALVGCLIPVLLAKKCNTKGNFMDYLLRFGGGILLATTFLHLLPEVREGIEEHVAWSYPVQLGELLMCIGFFFIYAVEELAHKMLGHSHHESDVPAFHEDHHCCLLPKATPSSPPPDPGLTLQEIKKEFLRLSDDTVLSSFDSDEEEVFCTERPKLWKWRKTEESCENLIPSQVKGSLRSRENCGSDLNKVWTRGTPIRAILITLAISIHQVFEGLAVGLETHTSQVWILTGAVAAHKGVIALCIGAEVSKARRLGAVVLTGVFTLATPVGICLGLALSTGVSLGLVPVLLQGLACGTLLYVVFFEVLSRPEGSCHFGHFLVTVAGFILMFILLSLFES